MWGRARYIERRGTPPHTDGHDPLRVAHLTTIDMSLALLLATELTVDVEAGFETVGISAPGPYVERVEALGVRHVPLPSLTRRWRPGADARAFAELVAALRELRPDVLHTHNPKTGVMGRIAGRVARVPIVVNTCHGLWARPEDSWRRRAFVYGLEGLAARFSHYELFQNAQDEATIRWALKPGRHEVVGNGIDLARFTPDPEGRGRLRREWGIPEDVLVVGAVGRRVAEKGLAEVGVAASALTGRARVLWVGPDDGEDLPGGTDDIVFVPEQSDMAAVYSAFDVFVLASYREGFSRAAMEAAACGLPMVLSDIRGCREVGEDGTHLLLAPPRDPAALTAALTRLLDDPALRERLGAAARERALTSFDQRAVAAASLRTYAAVAARKGLPWPASATHPAALAGTSTATAAADQAGTPDRRVSVLHVLPDDRNRGAQVFAGQLRDALRDDPSQRHLVATLFASEPGAARPDVNLGVPSGRARRAGLDPRAVRALRAVIAEHEVDVVVAHGGEPLKYVVAAQRSGRVAPWSTVYYKVGLSSAELSRASRVRLYRFLASRMDLVVGVSGAITRQLRDELGVPSQRLRTIPNGRDAQRYHPGPGERRDPPLVLFVGQLEPGKRPGLFLDVIGQLRDRGVACAATIVGDGPMRGSIETRAASLGVDLLGVRTDVPELLRAASVLVMTSAPDTEGMPGVLVEAGLSGLPVVSTPAAGVADVVEEGVTGFIASDAASLADRVAEIVTDPGLRARLGRAARERCVERFSLESTATAWRGLVEELASTSRSGARSVVGAQR